MTEQFFICPQTGLKRDWIAERATERAKAATIALAAAAQRRNTIARICARYELESDEFYTAEQKASRYL